MNNLYFNTLDQYKIEKKEYCFIKENTDRFSETFKVYIPKLMPLLNMKDQAAIFNKLINNNIFLNDVKCKISSSTSYQVQNYLTVKRKKNTWFKLHPQTFEKYTRLICEIPELNIRNIQITDDEFNTDVTPKALPVYVTNPLYDFISKIKVGDQVKFIFEDYNDRNLTGCPNNEQHYGNESHDPSQIRPTFHHEDVDADGYGSFSVDWPDPICKILKYTELTGTVTQLYDWGCVVSIGGKTYPVPASHIIGFYKKAGEYSSFYDDTKGVTQ
jgi:hypothetical protein